VECCWTSLAADQLSTSTTSSTYGIILIQMLLATVSIYLPHLA
jgi:hypothetical protein